MTLVLQSPTFRRMVLAQCCGAADSPLTEQQQLAVLTCLGDKTWDPTPQNTPVSFGLVEAWYADQQTRRSA